MGFFVHNRDEHGARQRILGFFVGLGILGAVAQQWQSTPTPAGRDTPIATMLLDEAPEGASSDEVDEHLPEPQEPTWPKPPEDAQRPTVSLRARRDAAVRDLITSASEGLKAITETFRDRAERSKAARQARMEMPLVGGGPDGNPPDNEPTALKHEQVISDERTANHYV